MHQHAASFYHSVLFLTTSLGYFFCTMISKSHKLTQIHNEVFGTVEGKHKKDFLQRKH